MFIKNGVEINKQPAQEEQSVLDVILSSGGGLARRQIKDERE